MRLLLVVALMAMCGCGADDLSLTFPRATAEQLSAAQEAVTEWRTACGVDVRVSRDDGDVTIQLQPAGSLGGDGGHTHWHALPGFRHVPTHVNIDERYATTRSVYAHEFGHALGLDHRSYGIMQSPLPVPPLPEIHVAPTDCP